MRRVIFIGLFTALFAGLGIPPVAGAGSNFIFLYDGPDTIYVDSSCTAPLVYPPPTAISNLPDVTIEFFELQSISGGYGLGDPVPAGTDVTITYLAQDEIGNEEEFSFTISFVDTMPPVFDPAGLPPDTALLCGGILPDYGLTATDNCDPSGGDIVFSSEGVPPAFSCEDTTVVVTYTAEDPFGNQTTYQQTVTVIGDTLAPIFINFPPDSAFACEDYPDGFLQWVQQLRLGLLISDNACGLESVTDNLVDSLLPADTCGMIQILFTATDACGNARQRTWQATVEDTIAPIIQTRPHDLLLYCDSVNLTQQIQLWLQSGGGGHATDNCSDTIEWSIQPGSLVNTGQCADTTTVVFIATDLCGNATMDSARIFLHDTFPPFWIAYPLDTLLECTAGPPDSLFTDWLLSFGYGEAGDYCTDNPQLVLQFGFRDSIYNLAGIQAALGQELASGCEDSVLYDAGSFDGIVADMEIDFIVADLCGNASVATGRMLFQDTESPKIDQAGMDRTVSCEGAGMIDSLFSDWIQSGGGALSSDDCGAVGYMTDPPPDTLLALLSQRLDTACAVSGQVTAVFWAVDPCGHRSSDSMILTFRVVDDIPPLIEYCPADSILYAGPDSCSRWFRPNLPPVSDGCGGESSPQVWSQTMPLTSAMPGSPVVPVDIVAFAFYRDAVLSTVGDSIVLTISIENADIEGETEFLILADENGQPLLRSAPSEMQCGDSDTTIAVDRQRFLQWASDGVISFDLYPNLPADPRFAVNDLCPSEGSSVTLSIAFDRVDFPCMQIDLIVDGTDTITDYHLVLDPLIFTGGDHTIEYLIHDGAGNAASCQQTLSVVDTVSPVIACPPDTNLVLASNSCMTQFVLPAPVSITDNCGSTTHSCTFPPDTIPAYLPFRFDPNTGDFVAEDRQFSFADLPPQSLGDALLEVAYRFDDQPGSAYYTFYGEDGSLIGRTDTLMSQCGQVVRKQFVVPQSVINQWLLDSTLTIDAVSNTNYSVGGLPGQGINPCRDVVHQDGDTDSMSMMRLTLEYESIVLTWSSTGATVIDPTTALFVEDGLQVSLAGGLSRLTYSIEDGSGNLGQCEFTVEVIDTLRPRARCRNINATVHPSGEEDLVVYPGMLDNGSTDNCGIDSIWIFPSRFTCSDIGSQQQVSLFVSDAAGNVDSCISLVRINETVLQPSFDLDICDPDTLFLSANPPPASGDVYTYQWVGPRNFTSTQAQPVITGVNETYTGLYSVTVTGLNGCTSTGSVNVIIEDIATPEIEEFTSVVCQGDFLELSANAFSGNVMYEWYSGTAPNGVLLGTTLSPTYRDTLPIGSYQFYVIVRNPDCVSNPSGSVTIEVIDRPVAEIDPVLDTPCEGDTIRLRSVTGGPTYQYNWSGPDGFISDQRVPDPIPNAQPKHAGIYSLQVNIGDCFSETAIARVIVLERPDRPIVVPPAPICEGQDLIMTVNNVLDGTRYIWYHPNGSTVRRPENTLVLENIGTEATGTWYVRVESSSCISDYSAPIPVTVEEQPDLVISNSGPVCEGDSVQLYADTIPGAEYDWSGPMGFTSNEVRPRLQAAPGLYFLHIETLGGCEADATTAVEIIRPPVIQSLSNDGLDCVDGTSDVCFQHTIVPPDDGTYLYDWSLQPGGTQVSTDSVLCIDGATEDDNGVYSLQVSWRGCESNILTSLLDVTDIYFRPTVEAMETSICQGDSIILSTEELGGEGVEYHWITPGRGEIVSPDSLLVIPQSLLSDGGDYTIFVTNERCTTFLSDPELVEVRPRPVQPAIDGDAFYCSGDTVSLQAIPAIAGGFQWTGPGGFTATGSQLIRIHAREEYEGSYFVTAIRDGCPSIPSEPYQVIVNPMPPEPILVPAQDSICLGPDMRLELCIDPSSLIPGARYYFGLADNGEILTDTALSSCRFISADLLPEGSVEFVAAIEWNGCHSEYSLPARVDIFRPPAVTANAGEDIILCGQLSGRLQALESPPAVGRWMDPASGIDLADRQDAGSAFELGSPGIYPFVWGLSYGACRDVDRDTVIVEAYERPMAADDNLVLEIGGEGTVDLLANDNWLGGYTLSRVSGPAHGQVEDLGDGLFTYHADNGFAGMDEWRYELCLESCPDLCAEAVVQIQVGDFGDCSVPTLITPNGDGINDIWIIQCLEDPDFLGNEVYIFNEWGDEVYHAAPYRNNWQGTYRGDPLPEGTYFYVLDYGRDGLDPKSGFIVIER